MSHNNPQNKKDDYQASKSTNKPVDEPVLAAKDQTISNKLPNSNTYLLQPDVYDTVIGLQSQIEALLVQAVQADFAWHERTNDSPIQSFMHHGKSIVKNDV